jgi:uncharacterized membrane protein
VSDEVTNERGLERLLANVLSIGTWLGSATIAIGLILQCMNWGRAILAVTCLRMVTYGIALFIALPVLRVALMAVAFFRQRELIFSATAFAVLAVIAAAACIGMHAG